jgi:hypothetical protein
MNLKNEIVINDSYEFVTCRVCGKQSKRLYGGHLKSHGMTSEDYLENFPNSPLMAKKDTEKQGKHMKEEKYKKMFSEMFSGENNPNHTSNTTEEVRRSRSPFSKDFVGYKEELNDDKRLDFIEVALKDRVLTTSLEYYLNKGYNEETAKEMLSERQKTFSKNICIKKYGEEEGIKIFNQRQEKWIKTLIENGNLKGGYSLISQELFEFITQYYPNDEIDNLYFAKSIKNSEYFLYSKEEGYRIYDFVDLKNRKIIEFNGDVYHGNPEIFKEDDIPNPFKNRNKTAKEMWEYDEEKIKFANNKGFEVLTIWEKEYKKNKEETLNKCLDFLGIKKPLFK